MLDTLEKTFLSPLGSEWCNLYYFLMIFALVFLAIMCYYTVVLVLKRKVPLYYGVLSIAPALISYIVNRLLYSICIKSL